ncbi:uncharacterized protein F4822DRAFT_432298 [Hypoxylon trugodes]|uniref:uncharacterized protein n=1 Tax=Hypoxylon trugodes TaxID=326681 RepID=UPI002191AEF6|nr:uncharacterized protein F4822DRAFT_432298 [Hypoxylon trugodes]KAI1385446.1 hypothetical protein F4822DRAFT_432298 [Hypoxylon trugodes]
MADNKEKVPSTSEVDAKKTDPSSDNTTQADSGDNKQAEDTAAADAGSTTSQFKPTKHLPTHYRGMPKQWEKNRVPKKDTQD